MVQIHLYWLAHIFLVKQKLERQVRNVVGYLPDAFRGVWVEHRSMHDSQVPNEYFVLSYRRNPWDKQQWLSFMNSLNRIRYLQRGPELNESFTLIASISPRLESY
jgi:hypothetical protein